ncbi:MAG TPA: protein phosphatase 2C domain-containing protein [Stellaceae bacterium]|jgi:protein phosphatase/serine/threonine-protein phosphatase Stp1|nr:protein phosphatase 2C domain-containing protein [Stellaceae bacterium]
MSTVPITAEVVCAGSFRSFAATHVGTVRNHNEDHFVNRPDLGVWAVADGAGGHQAGEVAARIVAEALAEVPKGLAAAELLAEVRLRILHAHDSIRAEAARRGGGAILATTIVALLAHRDHYACLWAGDSRAYLLRGGRLSQVTHDHSLVQELVDAGAITPEEALTHPRGNVITRAVGADFSVLELDKVTDRLRRGDRFLLCSDGVSKIVPETEIARLLAADGVSPAEHLIAAALDRNCDDNVTAVAVELLTPAARPELDDTVSGFRTDFGAAE